MKIIHTHTGHIERLDRVLSRKMSEFSREDIKEAIKEGFVYIDDVLKTRPSTRICSGQTVMFQLMEFKKSFFQNPDSPPESHVLQTYVRILAEYPEFIFVYKPAGLLVHQTHNPNSISLVEILKAQFPEIDGVGENCFEEGPDRSGIVHRIDKDTSGVLVVARTQEAYMNLKQAFQNREVNKLYAAIVRGRVEREHGYVTYKLARSKTDHTRRTLVTDTAHKKEYSGIARDAKTEYWTQQYKTVHNITATHIAVRLHTGRTHQIRLHMKAIGHPLLGDKMYGGKWEKHHSPVPRQLLHASYLGLWYKNRYYEATADIPSDMYPDKTECDKD